ncbi:MAG: HNH endonuclease [Candidatus Micrarchaeota archaeon]
MIKPGDVISYWEMCSEEGSSLQRGMNFHLKGRNVSVILMSLRPNAPYADRVEENGKVLIYEGHDISRREVTGNPKSVDQPSRDSDGSPTQNLLFYDAAIRCKNDKPEPELVKVYEKLKPGIWVFNGLFRLVNAWQEASDGRQVFKFRLEIAEGKEIEDTTDLEHSRLIPSNVKLEVWKRDKGQCIKCHRKDNLHFDHVLPYSKGGTSLLVENIQILCARHNLQKRAKIE